MCEISKKADNTERKEGVIKFLHNPYKTSGFINYVENSENTPAFFRVRDIATPDGSLLNPHIYEYTVSFRCENNPDPSYPSQIIATDIVIEKMRGLFPLMEWAYFPTWDENLCQLSKMALFEVWDYKDGKSGKYPILHNYLRHTFDKLKNDEQIFESENHDYAIFNTGLVNGTYKAIYALFTKNPTGNGPYWKFYSFCVLGEDAGKKLYDIFKELPERALYFTPLSEVVYDPAATKTVLDTDNIDHFHILMENADRLPPEFVKKYYPTDLVELIQTLKDNKHKKEERACRQEIKKFPYADQQWYKDACNRLDTAIKLAEKRATWNFRTVVPMYYPREKMPSLLFPLSLVTDSIEDAALVVERLRTQHYQGHTILTLKQAYCNARLVMRLDSDWLATDKIVRDGDDLAVEEDDDTE